MKTRAALTMGLAMIAINQKFSKRTLSTTIRQVLFLWLSLGLGFSSTSIAQVEKEETKTLEVKPIELVNSANGIVVDFGRLSDEQKTWVVETIASEEGDAKLAQRFPVRISSSDEETPAMLGKYHFSGTKLRFEPRFAFRKGVTYLASQLRTGKEPLEFSFSIPVEKTKPASVSQVYPTSSELPENLLKFYVHFSAPMRKGNIYEHLSILKSDGTEVELPFLEIDQELWSRDGLRLTLLLDPGRIKRGLKPREEMGPIFEAGQKYELVISDSWLDSKGLPLSEEFRKSFSVGKVDEEQPDPRRWRIEVPSGQSQSAMVMTLDEPCDSALLMRIFKIENQFGNSFLKSVELDENEQVVRFYPKEPWWPGMYNLKVSGILEDLCGNSIEKKFDIDKFRATRESDDIEMTEIEFEVK